MSYRARCEARKYETRTAWGPYGRDITLAAVEALKQTREAIASGAGVVEAMRAARVPRGHYVSKHRRGRVFVYRPMRSVVAEPSPENVAYMDRVYADLYEHVGISQLASSEPEEDR